MATSEKIKVLCRSCLHPTNHEVVFTKDVSGESDDEYIRWSTEYQLLQCLGCDDMTFRTAETNSENGKFCRN
jgi:hypothetical protein